MKVGGAAVDIVIPYYKGIEYLRQSIESVRVQTFKNFRLLVIDDGSTNPDARDLIESLGDPRIQYEFNEKNIGLSANFEKAKNAISAEWGVILGHDDRLHPNYLEQMLEVVGLFPSAAIIQPRIAVIDQNGLQSNPLPDRFKKLLRGAAHLSSGLNDKNLTLVKSNRAIELLMLGNFLYFPTLMWKNEALAAHSFRNDLFITVDLEIIVNILLSEGDLLLVNETLAEYRRHNKSLSGMPELKYNRLKEEVNIYVELGELLKSKGLNSAYWLAKIRIFNRLHILLEISKALIKGKYRESLEYLRLLLPVRSKIK